MANILATFNTTANALAAYDKVLEVAQNNVANVSTPGYARQRMSLAAMLFNPDLNIPGGVEAGTLVSSRNEYAEQAVRRQNTALGREQQAVNSLTSLESIFDVSGNSGLPGALSDFFQSVSAWGQTPSNQAARQTVIDKATDVARNFQSTAGSLATLLTDTDKQLRDTVDHVNQLTAQLASLNHEVILGGVNGTNDAGLDAKIHAALEDLSQLIDVTAAQQPDGTFTVLIDGAKPLVMADRQYAITVVSVQPDTPPPTYLNAPPTAKLLHADGVDLTANTTDGQLGALLDMRNRMLPSYLGDAYQAGDLNRLAKQFADRVNELLAGGWSSAGPPPSMGVPLFQYDATDDAHTASTLSVDSAVTPDQLGAITPGPPVVSNGVPLALSKLATPTGDADKIDGISYHEFYGKLASRAGAALDSANKGLAMRQSLLAQAKSQRQDLSGVSLDNEALVVVEFQRAYEANSRLITVLDELTQAVINILK